MSNKRHIEPKTENLENRKRTCHPKVVPKQEDPEAVDSPVIDLELKTEKEAPGTADHEADLKTEISLEETVTPVKQTVYYKPETETEIDFYIGGEGLMKPVRRADEKNWHCPYDSCEYNAYNKSQVRRHIGTHSGQKPFECEICSTRFTSNSALVRHKRNLHSRDGKPFKCDQCEYAARDSSKLVVHKRIHTGEKPFKCDQCNFASSTSSALYIHKQTHSIEMQRSFKCKHCTNATFFYKYQLDEHMEKHTFD